MKPEKLRNLMRDIMRDNPQASEKQINDACWKRCQKNADLQRALFDYWFANSYRDFTIESFGEHSAAVIEVGRQRETGRFVNREAVAALKERMKVVLMDFALSDGTLLRHATFGQCANEGNWLTAISKCGHAHEVVGKKLTESDLKSLLLRFTPPPQMRQRGAGATAARR